MVGDHRDVGARSQEQAIATAVIVAIIAGMLGGRVYQLSAVSTTVKNVGHVVPQAWAMDAFVKLISDHVRPRRCPRSVRAGVRGRPERSGGLVLLAEGVLDDVGAQRRQLPIASRWRRHAPGAGSTFPSELAAATAGFLVRDLLVGVQAHRADGGERRHFERPAAIAIRYTL